MSEHYFTLVQPFTKVEHYVPMQNAFLGMIIAYLKKKIKKKRTGVLILPFNF